MEYAGFWRRFAALAIDAILLGIIQTIIMMVFVGGVMATDGGEEAAGAAVLIINLAMIVAGWLYFAIMESSKRQATLGKMMIGIVVTDVNGQPIGFGKATGRYFGKLVSGIILGIGYLMVAFTQRKQALHDIMAGCLVVRKPKAA
jgi:uncharacterized RDD family membrane protein YckC